MEQLNIHEAKTHLSKLVARAEAGEEIIVARAGKPIAKIVPYEPAPQPAKRELGWLKGYAVPDDWKGNGWREEIEELFYGSNDAAKDAA